MEPNTQPTSPQVQPSIPVSIPPQMAPATPSSHKGVIAMLSVLLLIAIGTAFYFMLSYQKQKEQIVAIQSQNQLQLPDTQTAFYKSFVKEYTDPETGISMLYPAELDVATDTVKYLSNTVNYFSFGKTFNTGTAYNSWASWSLSFSVNKVNFFDDLNKRKTSSSTEKGIFMGKEAYFSTVYSDANTHGGEQIAKYIDIPMDSYVISISYSVGTVDNVHTTAKERAANAQNVKKMFDSYQPMFNAMLASMHFK